MKTAIVIGDNHDNDNTAIKVNQDKNPGRISRRRYKILSFKNPKSLALERLR